MSDLGYWVCLNKEEVTKYNYGEEVLIKPKTTVFVQAKINLKAVIESEKKIKFEEWMLPSVYDRVVPSLFWNENLVSSKGNIYVFETKYYTKDDEILPTPYLNQIPKNLTEKFLKEVPLGIHKLADILVDNETNTIEILKKFYEFVSTNIKPIEETQVIPIEDLLKEYETRGYFYGNCKQARDFYAALCNSKKFPTKKVGGKNLGKGGHVWVDVFVPTTKGYKLFPVDAMQKYFGKFNPLSHIFFEPTPDIEGSKEEYKFKLKIESKD